MKRPVLWASAVALTVVAAFAAFLSTRDTAEGQLTPSRLVGQQAPAIRSTTVGGESFKLASLRGSWVVLNFFASWCPPCKEEAPELVGFEWTQRQQANGAKVVSVIFNDSNAAAAQFHEFYGARWPLVTDPGGNTAASFGVVSPPETFIISPKGKVVDALPGGVTKLELLAKLAEAKTSGRA